MFCNALPLIVDGDCFRASLYSNFSAAIGCGDGVAVRVEADGTETIHSPVDTFTRVKGISGKRIQLRFLLRKHHTNREFLATDLVG